MKQLLALLLACISMDYAIGQDFPDAFIVKQDEVTMKECPFDKEADAVVLMHEAYADHDDRYQLITNHRVRLKILKEKGLSHGDIRIMFYSRDNFEYVEVVRGRISNEIDGRLQFQELDKKSVFKKPVNKYWSEMVFAFPNVKVGSIIEYTYRSTMQSYSGLEDWQFQKSIPVAESKYSVVILPDFEFAYRVQKREDYPIDIKADKSIGRISFTMKNIPGLRNEPYIDARKDYLQMVTFQLSGRNIGYKKNYMTNWEEVIRELNLNSSFGNQLGKDLAGTSEFIKMVKMEPSETRRLAKVYEYVKTNITWNGLNSVYVVDGIRQAWSRKTGTSSEVNLALTSLLRDVGLEAYPMLVSEREHGKVNVDYPFIDQFNTVYAYAIADGKKYYLDGTDRFTPPHIIPYSILNTTALVVNRKSGGLIHIADDMFEYKDYVNVTGILGDDGKITGNVYMSCSDYARTKRLSSYRSNTVDYVKKFSGETGDVRVDSFVVLNEDIDTLPLQHKFKFTTAVNGTGDYTFIPTTLFSELKGNPFLSDVRFSKVNFGYRQTYFLNSYINIPASVKIDVLPKSVRMVNPDKSISFTRSVLYDEKERKIVSRVTVEMKKSLYDTDEYASLHEFFKKMYEYLGEPIVIKKS